MSKTTFIYALCDPDSGAVRYVGKADEPKRRFRRHLREKEINHRTCWLRGLQAQGKLPKLELLLEVASSDWAYWEQEMVRLFREQGADLVNSTDGGDGGQNPSPGTREKMRAAKLGRKLSSEHRQKIGDASRGRVDSPETVANKVAAQRLRKQTKPNSYASGWKNSFYQRSFITPEGQARALQTRMKSGPRADNTSGYKGVARSSKNNKWAAEIHLSGKKMFLGYFDTAEEAARARDTAAKTHYPPGSYLNFPNE